jgi:hypothetical protein
MKHTIECDISSGVCAIRVTGPHKRPEDSHELLRIAAATAEVYGCSHFLFDMREAAIVGSTMGAFYTASDPEKYGVSRFYRIAAVYTEVTKDHRFMENVGFNRGVAAFRVFDNIDEAREWLASE